MKILRKLSKTEIDAAFSGRSGKHVRDMLEGRCGHRKYGEIYDTYHTCNPYWEIQCSGPLRHISIPFILTKGFPNETKTDYWKRLSLFRFLWSCDMCKRNMIRWPWWQPPIKNPNT